MGTVDSDTQTRGRMFRSMYDNDITTWSPMGRLHQIEYAQEAVKQGSATLGLRSDTHVVVAALLRKTKKLSGYQPKLFRVDDQYVFDSPLQVTSLVNDLADKAQTHTQDYSSRPYGVGLLVAGYDKKGPHLFETSPSGSAYDYRAQAIGARSQSARTYLERHYETFSGASEEELLEHAIRALAETTGDDDLSTENASIMIVGEGTPVHELTPEEIQVYLDRISGTGASNDNE